MNNAEQLAQDYLARCDFRADDRGNAEVGLPLDKSGDGILSRTISLDLIKKFSGQWYDEGSAVYFSKPLFDNWEEVYRSEIITKALPYYEAYVRGMREFVAKYTASA